MNRSCKVSVCVAAEVSKLGSGMERPQRIWRERERVITENFAVALIKEVIAPNHPERHLSGGKGF